jgi:hypothetical protein
MCASLIWHSNMAAPVVGMQTENPAIGNATAEHKKVGSFFFFSKAEG